jgi:hypothetical protein
MADGIMAGMCGIEREQEHGEMDANDIQGSGLLFFDRN